VLDAFTRIASILESHETRIAELELRAGVSPIHREAFKWDLDPKPVRDAVRELNSQRGVRLSAEAPGGNQCGKCGSDDTTFEERGDPFPIVVTCHACGHEWRIAWRP
jgi:hypothetical protein